MVSPKLRARGSKLEIEIESLTNIMDRKRKHRDFQTPEPPMKRPGLFVTYLQHQQHQQQQQYLEQFQQEYLEKQLLEQQQHNVLIAKLVAVVERLEDTIRRQSYALEALKHEISDLQTHAIYGSFGPRNEPFQPMYC